MELDYALGWALRGIADHEYLAGRLVFKGGTCLRKCYFPDYRFSEDLDFTATEWFGWEAFEKAVGEAFAAVQRASGIDFAARSSRLRVIDDEYGRESLRFTLYWRGPHASGGSPPGLRLDITRNEILAFSPVSRLLFHPFSDADDLREVRPGKLRWKRPTWAVCWSARASSTLTGSATWLTCSLRVLSRSSTTYGIR
ncbi:nucleotidyl transferase AbiEii/AbiGii toxin family protein [Candidatus Palauibacter sp.]|uniref:nucleotidyl transferase AbiEii/AbiGii toxin family protein n=1 Tax=Candidatus Palauibacter sp. TaxID=3101350 RepID=UPI003B027272